MNKNEVITPTNRYSCDKCFHIYSPWLSKKCPKCKHKHVKLSSDSWVNVPMDLEYVVDNITLEPPIFPNFIK